MMPNTAAQTVSAAATTSSGTPGMRSARSWPRSPVSVGGSGGPGGRRPQHPGRLGLADQAAEHRRRAGGRGDGVGRGLVAGHGRAVEQGVLVRVGQSPVPGRAGRRPPAGRVVLPGAGGVGLLDGRAQGVVTLDDQRGQQLVPAGEVAVDGRRHHAQLPGHGPQRQGGGTVGGQPGPGDVGDLPGQLGADPLPGGGAWRHGVSLTERWTQNRAALWRVARMNAAGENGEAGGTGGAKGASRA